MSTKVKVSKDRQLLEEQTRKALKGLAILNPDVQDQIIHETLGQPEILEEEEVTPPLPDSSQETTA
ncbi:MAG TPA: hypothetical protein PKZ24_02110, partial [Nitrospirales bacterium]|nr:hypothetical protein [Nitrospirales bacterium]